MVTASRFSCSSLRILNDEVRQSFFDGHLTFEHVLILLFTSWEPFAPLRCQFARNVDLGPHLWIKGLSFTRIFWYQEKNIEWFLKNIFVLKKINNAHQVWNISLYSHLARGTWHLRATTRFHWVCIFWFHGDRCHLVSSALCGRCHGFPLFHTCHFFFQPLILLLWPKLWWRTCHIPEDPINPSDFAVSAFIVYIVASTLFSRVGGSSSNSSYLCGTTILP